MTEEVAPWDSPAPNAPEVAPWDSPAPQSTAAVSDTPSPPETAGRVAGLATRALGRGAADVPAMVAGSDIPTNPLSPLLGLNGPVATVARAGLDKLTGQENSTGTKLSDLINPTKWADAVDYFADKAGLAKPQTPGERVASKALEAAPSAVLSPQAPIIGGLSAMAGSAASQGAKEAGWNPVAQTLAGLAAGSVPAIGAAGAAGLRGLVRGGAEGQAEMQSNLADAAATGTNLSLGQASGSTGTQYLEGALRKIPGSGPLKKLPGQQAESLGSNVQSIVDNLAPGTDVSPTEAGSAINMGGAAAKDNMAKAESAAFAQRDALVPHDTPTPLTNTMSALDKLASPTPGAEATTAALIPQKIKTMRDNLTADTAAAGATGPHDAQLPYLAVRQLRTAVGNQIDWGFAPANPVENGALKKVYGSLSDDLTAGASTVSPEAAQAATSANALYAANQSRREFLNSVIDKNGGPEAVFQAATNGTKLGATKISGVMSELEPPQQNVVRATVLDRLGRATAGAQNSEGTAFSPSTFLTNWAKLDPSAKDALFGASGNSGSLRAGLDSLTRTMSNIKSGTKLQNWSGTTEAAGHGAGLVAAFESLRALAAGDPHVLAATGAGLAATNILSRALTNPKVVNWFAQTTKAPMSALPNAVNQLTQMKDSDAQALAQYLQQPSSPPPIQRASGGRVDVDSLVERLIRRWRETKRATDASTKPLLRQPDSAIVRALDIAGRSL